MKNPWLKKNPWLSMWLSGANAVAGAARGHAAVYGKRQQKAMIASTNRRVAEFWTEVLTTKPARKRKPIR